MHFAQIRQILKANLNRARCDFGRNQFKKEELLSLASSDVDALEKCLNEWQAAGYLRVVVPLSTAGYETICVETLSYVEVQVPN